MCLQPGIAVPLLLSAGVIAGSGGTPIGRHSVLNVVSGGGTEFAKNVLGACLEALWGLTPGGPACQRPRSRRHQTAIPHPFPEPHAWSLAA